MLSQSHYSHELDNNQDNIGHQQEQGQEGEYRLAQLLLIVHHADHAVDAAGLVPQLAEILRDALPDADLLLQLVFGVDQPAGDLVGLRHCQQQLGLGLALTRRRSE
jgi:hypothetical protein